MAGTYLIGASTGADFADFTEAVAALNTLGVCDHVIFDVESGTYTEQITINSILGSGPDRTVTFRAETLDSSDVELTFNASSPVVTLNSANWVRFKHLTISNTSTLHDQAINISGTTEQTIIERCRFIGNYASTSSNAAMVVSTTGINDSIQIINNRFEGGGYAIYMYGASTTSLESGLLIERNQMIDQYYHALRLYYQNAPKVKGNYFTSNSAYSTGAAMYMVYCDNGMDVSANHVVTDPSSPAAWPYYGMYVSLCDGAGFTNTGRIYNNRIVIGADTNTTSTSTFYGIYMTSSNAQRLVHNTVTVMGGGTSARAFYQSASDLVYFKNNLFTSYSSGHAAYFASGIAVEINRNNYYAPNGNALRQVSGLIHIASPHHGDVIRQQLQRYSSQKWTKSLRTLRDLEGVVGHLSNFSITFAHDGNDLTVARLNLLDVTYHFVVLSVFRSNHKYGHVLID